EPGRIELRPTPRAPTNLPNRIAACLNEWTGRRWLVGVSTDRGAPTLKEQAEAAVAERRRRAAEHPLGKAVLGSFPGAMIDDVRELNATEEAEDDEVPADTIIPEEE